MSIRFGPFSLDPDRALLLREEIPVELQPKVLDLVILLSSQPHRIFSKQELLCTLWPETIVTEASLHQSIRKARKALGDDPDHPCYIEAVSRRGWRWIAAVEQTHSSHDEPMLAVDGFVGRRKILDLVGEKVRPGAVVLLHGIGGIGKTRLAREAVARLSPRWQGASVWVSLASCESRTEIARAVGRALSIPIDDPQAAEEIVKHALPGRSVLLVLDEAEACAAELAFVLEQWRAALLRVGCLVTSRIAIDGILCIDVPPLPDDEAALLLRSRAAHDNTSLDDREVSALLALLDGLPLGIELAAARLRLMSPQQLALRLSRNNAVLSSAERSVEAPLVASFEMLDEPDRHLLCGCAVFDGYFSAEEAEEAGGDVLDGLDRLIRASLVVHTAAGLSLAGFVRTFAIQRASAGYGASFIEGFVQAMLRLAHLHVPLAIRFDTHSLLALQERTSRLAAAHLRAHAPDDRARLAEALALACRYTGPWDLADEALAMLETRGTLAQVLCGEYAARFGRMKHAERCLYTVTSGEHDLNASPAEIGYAHLLLARLFAANGRLDDSFDSAKASLRYADIDENDALAGLALDAMGTVFRLRAIPDEVRRCYRAAVARLQRPSCRIVRGAVSQNQAVNLSALGLYDEGIIGLMSALDALEALPVPHLVATVRGNLAQALLAAGRASEAVALLEIAQEQARRTGDRVSGSKYTIDLALALVILGDGLRSEALLDAELEDVNTFGGPLSRVLTCRAWAALCRGEHALAVARMSTALDAVSDEGSPAAVKLWALARGLAVCVGDSAFSERLWASPPRCPPTPELSAWVETCTSRPQLSHVSSGLLPVDTWALWTAHARQRERSPSA